MNKKLNKRGINNLAIHKCFITFVILALLLLMSLLVKGSFDQLKDYSSNKQILDLAFILFCIVMLFGVYFLDKKKVSKKIILMIILSIGFLLRIFYAFSIDSKPVSDFAIMFSTGTDILNGDFSNLWGTGYIARFPHITIPTLYFALIQLIFPKPLLAIKFFNVIASTCNIYIIYCIVKELFNIEREARIAAVITALYPPLILYTAIYTTENIAIPFFLLGIYYFILVINNKKKWKYLLLASVYLSVGNLFRKVAAILMVAFILFLIVSYRDTIKKKCIYIIIVILGFIIPFGTVSLVLHNTGVIEYQLWKGREPSLTNIVKGLNIEYKGKWNPDDAKIPDNYNFDYQKIEEVCKEIIEERLTKTEPSKLIEFFKYKFVSQWTIGDFSGAYWAEHGLEDSDMFLKFSEKGIWFSQLFCVILIGLSYIGLLNFKESINNNAIAIIYYVFCGYGILYLISENQARYGYVVCWVFILMGSIGINLMDKILRRILLYGKDK